MAFTTHGIQVLCNAASVNQTLSAVVHCSDGMCVEMPKNLMGKLEFIKHVDDGKMKFGYPGAVLRSLAIWTLKYGKDGVALTSMTRPCIYRNVQHVLKDSWEKDFFSNILMDDLSITHYLQTINAAEEFGMKGLHDFLCVCLSCKLRNEEDAEVVGRIMGLEDCVEMMKGDLENAVTRYTWLEEAIKPMVRK